MIGIMESKTTWERKHVATGTQTIAEDESVADDLASN